MADPTRSDLEDRIRRLEQYHNDLTRYFSGDDDDYYDDSGDTPERRRLRSKINMETAWVRRQVLEAGCLVTVTVGPPPAVGGLIMRNVDPFAMLFQDVYGQSLIP